MRKIIKLISIILALELVLCLANVVPVLAGPDADVDLSKSSGTVGSEITIEGFDYDEYESILITFGEEADEWAEEADNNGDWEVDIEIPEVPYGTYTITITGEDSPTINKNFRVLPGIVLEKTSGKPGDTITVSGTGFRADEEGIEVTFNGEIMEDNIDADEWGSWECELTVPSGLTPGRYEIDAYGDDTRASAVDNVFFTLAAGTGITLSRTSGAVGTAITVTGTGFAANESDIRITYDGTLTGSPTRANSSGGWSLTFTVPESTSGSHIVDASGSITSASSVPDQSFNVIPSFTLTPTSAPAGGTVNVKGSGFAADETGITLTYDGSPIGQVVRANSRGGWSNSFTVPSSGTGSHVIDAYGDETSASYTNNVNFIVGAGIVLNKYSGTPETAVNVTGSGFAAREQGIEVLFSGTQVVGGITASETGTWSASFTVPNFSSGEYIVDARGSITQPTTIPDITYTVTPGISLSQASGPAGTALTITGTGFASNERGITISFDDSEISSGINADAGGKWTATLSVPPSVAGSHSIRIKGAATDTSTIGNLSFRVTAGITINPSSGTVGSEINVTGSGFAPISILKFYFDDNEISAGTVTADAFGGFTKRITIPQSKSGTYVIKVIDAQNNAANANFSIDATPPAVPIPLTPSDGQTVGLFGGANPTFTWSKPNSSSDVTYTLQIDTNLDFSSLIVNKTGLTSTRYTLSNAESLPRGKYFWRVKATDTAANQSEWSQPSVLKSGVMSPGVFALIIILVIAGIAAALYFLFLRRYLLTRREERAAAMATAAPSPDIVIPNVVNAEFRMLDTDAPSRKRAGALPWRLALPQAPQYTAKGSKILSTEDQARLQSIVEFARSLPLIEPGNNTRWLVDLAENSAGSTASPALYAQLLKGEVQVRYEPSWMRHPTFLDLQSLLEGQPLLQDLDSYVDSVNHAADESVMVLQDIYRNVITEISWDVLADGGWDYVSAIYSDAISWFQCKCLREPSDKDYQLKTDGNSGPGTEVFELHGEPNTPFAGQLIRVTGEQEALQLRSLHLKLRRNYRNNDQVRDMVALITQLSLQRNRLLHAFSQFNRLNS